MLLHGRFEAVEAVDSWRLVTDQAGEGTCKVGRGGTARCRALPAAARDSGAWHGGHVGAPAHAGGRLPLREYHPYRFEGLCCDHLGVAGRVLANRAEQNIVEDGR